MTSVGETLFGPLAGLECRRSLGRRWVLVVRALAAVLPAGVVLVVVWLWWFTQRLQLGPWPAGEVRGGLLTVAGLAVTVAVLVGPALLSGALAGEKTRSTLGLLLAARVSSREIVLGRLAGGLCVVGVFAAAGAPALVFLAGLRGLGPFAVATLLALPAAVAFGSGGLTMAASAVARRGRDALLAVYCLELLLLLSPAFGSSSATEIRDWFVPLNPYTGLEPLAESGESGPALWTIVLWMMLGAAGCTVAAWRLRPAYLREANGRPRWRWLAGWGRVPPVGDRAILWKELYVERIQAFGWLVRGLGILLAASFLVASLALAGMVAWWTWYQPDTQGADWAHDELAMLAEYSWPLVWLIQWAVGLRAAAAIASERQRGTWESLLITPVDGPEIVRGKTYGSVYALRNFGAALIFGWTAALACGALPAYEYGQLVADLLVVGAFMAVIGIGFSLGTETATRAMTLTILGWLAAAIAMAVLAGILTLMTMLAVVFVWFIWLRFEAGTPAAGAAGPPLGTWPGILYHGIRLLLYLAAALLFAAWCRSHFDRLAGRSFPSDSLPAQRRPRAREKCPGS